MDNFDAKISNDEWNDEDTDKMKEAAAILLDENVNDLFNGYYYDRTVEMPSLFIKPK